MPKHYTSSADSTNMHTTLAPKPKPPAPKPPPPPPAPAHGPKKKPKK